MYVVGTYLNILLSLAIDYTVLQSRINLNLKTNYESNLWHSEHLKRYDVPKIRDVTMNSSLQRRSDVDSFSAC